MPSQGIPRAVVTGGAGFIGSHLVKRLLHEGCAVTVVERPDASLENLRDLKVDLCTADITDISCPASILPVLRTCDVLFHVAGNPKLWARSKDHFQRVNREGTCNVLSAAAAARIPRVIYTSTESIVGISRIGAPSDEDTPARAEDMVGPYCLSKFQAEQAALEAAARGLDIVIVNPTIPVGPGDVNRTPPTRMIVDFLNGCTPAYMRCLLNVVDVRAIALGHILAWRNGVSGRRYILGGENLSVLQLLQMAGLIYGRKPPRIRIPYILGLTIAHVSELVSNHLTGREPAASVTGVRLTRRMVHLDCSRAVRELGFQPGNIQTALADAINWYQDRGWISSSTEPARQRLLDRA
jgi:dihydroflavonol-4-reductase